MEYFQRPIVGRRKWSFTFDLYLLNVTIFDKIQEEKNKNKNKRVSMTIIPRPMKGTSPQIATSYIVVTYIKLFHSNDIKYEVKKAGKECFHELTLNLPKISKGNTYRAISVCPSPRQEKASDVNSFLSPSLFATSSSLQWPKKRRDIDWCNKHWEWSH